MTQTVPTQLPTEWRDFFALTKPRVMSLVIFTGLCGLLAAPGHINPVLGFTAILCIALGAGGAAALNQWWEADIDAGMKRTAARPLPAGRMNRSDARDFGVLISAASVMIMGLAVNWLSATILALSIFYYAVIYTVWLKPRTPQNIVIGGAAGAFPPMIGWAVATGSVSVESVLMFALTFMWTPPHFWALALFMNSDYDKANVPMLTVTHGRRVTRNHILGYTLALVPVAMGIGFTSIGGYAYLAIATGLNVMFLKGAYDVWRRDDATAEADGYRTEKRLFRLSLSYLFLHFAAILVEATMRSFGIGGW